MGEAPAPETLLFNVLTPLGFHVHVTRDYWEIIITIKHPVMLGHEQSVKDTLEEPSEIRQSKSDPEVYLFYKPERLGRWTCAIAKRRDNDGFLITATQRTRLRKENEYGPSKSVLR